MYSETMKSETIGESDLEGGVFECSFENTCISGGSKGGERIGSWFYRANIFVSEFGHVVISSILLVLFDGFGVSGCLVGIGVIIFNLHK